MIVQLADGFGRIEHLAGSRNARQHLLGEQWKLDEFLGIGPLRRAPEPGHALRYVCLETDPTLLAVIGDVHSGLALLGQHVSDPTLDQPVEPLLVHRASGFVLDQHVTQFVAARQTADMRGQDAIDALVHETPPTISKAVYQFCRRRSALPGLLGAAL